MLTPNKVREKQFQSSGRGSYRADDVDAFMNEVSASYEQMFKENGDLIRKISILAKKIEEYRADEESLKLALLNAQKLADQIVAEAKEKAEAESADAVAAAEKKVSDANAEAEEIAANSKRESAAILDSAKAEAERILADANAQANDILGNINRKVTHETLVFDMTKKEASEFKSKLVAMYKEHINLINKLPDIVDEQLNDACAPVNSEELEQAEEPTEENVAEVVAPEETIEAGTVEPSVEEPEVYEETSEIEPETNDEESETTFEDVYSDSVDSTDTSDFDEVPENTESEKSSFKLDLSKIDFTDDEDEVPETTPAAMAFEPLEEDEPEEAGGNSISFKNFFKKK